MEDDLPATSELVVPSRSVRLPLSWDDPATREAIARYTSGVRDDAPWCPSNIEFIRRVNGLASQADVMDIVFAAEYLTLGLGDVYLGAPVATPLDPRHRLVTTKYNPARTWTAENSVGIGGAYLCIYGMEGPGGYQFVGRTTQVWSRYRHTAPFEPGSPWLLRFFDRISWYPVSAEELLDLRADLAAGRGSVDITDGTFSLAEHERFLADNAASIAEFREPAGRGVRRRTDRVGGGRRVRPRRTGRVASRRGRPRELVLDDGDQRVDAPFSSSVWKVDVEVGERVVAGQALLALEAMKMETVLTRAGRRHRHPGPRRRRAIRWTRARHWSSSGHPRGRDAAGSRHDGGRAGARGVRRDRGRANVPRSGSSCAPWPNALADAEAVDAAVDAGADLPLAGLVAAVKNNVDVAGLPTTAGCPSYSTTPAAADAARSRVAGGGRGGDRRDQPRPVRHRSGRDTQSAWCGAGCATARPHLGRFERGIRCRGGARPRRRRASAPTPRGRVGCPPRCRASSASSRPRRGADRRCRPGLPVLRLRDGVRP